MNSFKDIAYQILKEAGSPLHSKRITEIALEKRFLKTKGKTPEATMNAQLVVDINQNKENSRFVKTGPSTFGLNPSFKETVALSQGVTSSRTYNSLATISTATTKVVTVADNYSMAVIFCFFDTSDGDLWDYLWFVPAPDFI